MMTDFVKRTHKYLYFFMKSSVLSLCGWVPLCYVFVRTFDKIPLILKNLQQNLTLVYLFVFIYFFPSFH